MENKSLVLMVVVQTIFILGLLVRWLYSYIEGERIVKEREHRWFIGKFAKGRLNFNNDIKSTEYLISSITRSSFADKLNEFGAGDSNVIITNNLIREIMEETVEEVMLSISESYKHRMTKYYTLSALETLVTHLVKDCMSTLIKARRENTSKRTAYVGAADPKEITLKTTNVYQMIRSELKLMIKQHYNREWDSVRDNNKYNDEIKLEAESYVLSRVNAINNIHKNDGKTINDIKLIAQTIFEEEDPIDGLNFGNYEDNDPLKMYTDIDSEWFQHYGTGTQRDKDNQKKFIEKYGN